MNASNRPPGPFDSDDDGHLELSRITIDSSPEGIFWLDESGRFTFVNRQAFESLGYDREQMLHLHLWDIDPDFPPERWVEQWQLMRRSGRRIFETRHRTRDGRIFPVEVCANQVYFRGIEFHTAFVRDISERVSEREARRNLEQQLLQAQKLESIGQLAGGVAHDFNNMLGVISGYTEHLLNMPFDASVLEDLRQVEAAARRSADLTRQLLAFARRQTIAPRILDLNEAVAELLKMLVRILGEGIELSWRPEARPALVNLDPSQIDQVLVNLCVNARDAINGRGTVTIETGNREFDAAYCADHAGALPGCYVMLAISDDGCGIDREHLTRIFEPFYTTKNEGYGTGLGLSTVFGIVKQNEGNIEVYSEPGEGTTFRIYLRAAEAESAAPASALPQKVAGGHETILVVEDEAAILELCRRQLERLGYRVLVADSPAKALALAAADERPIDLLITDVVMPRMNGNVLAAELREQRPGLTTLYFSGYTANVIAHHGVLEPGVFFLAKPFSLNELDTAVRRALERPTP
jgi:PAS domain S-box-containing protein